MKDQYGRTIDYMRISITDRCNLRCRYCMPDGVELVSMGEILTYEEIERICGAAASEGIRKLKITGGEPLVRLGCVGLIGKLKKIPGIEQVTLTTNGVLLEEYAEGLAQAGLDGVNISLDSLNRERYQWITGRDELDRVLKSIEAALEIGLKTKINVVLQKEVNEPEWESLVEMAKKKPLDVRFIEMMPIGYGKAFHPVSNEEILRMLREKYPQLKSDERVHGNGPAQYYKIPEFQGSIGFISAIHGKFCGNCNRIRLTSQGELKPCLCYGESYDLRTALRGSYVEKEGSTGKEVSVLSEDTRECEENLKGVREIIREAVTRKPKQHCFEQLQNITEEKRMVQIGG
mgnify:CR=1 FL=1